MLGQGLVGCLACAVAWASASPPEQQAHVRQRADGTLEVAAGAGATGAVAAGTFQDGLTITGWGILDVETSGAFPDAAQHHAAGMVEGFLTAGHIHANYLNSLDYVFGNNVSAPALQFLDEQMRWSKKQAQASPQDPLWYHHGLVLAQFDGLLEGYNAAAKQRSLPMLNASALQVLNAVGDLFQIIPAVDMGRRPNMTGMSSAQLRSFVRDRGLCSALVKVPGDFGDLFMAHSSWFQYSDTNRIFKHYHFQFARGAAAKRVSFSSYPGYLYSLDDFYMMDSGLGMVQTSNNIINQTLLDLITPESLLAWQRVRVANAVASTGEQWYDAFKAHASGTYVNQYMVVDFKLFTPGQALRDDTLWVVEEIPGLVAGADQTETLRRGYWPSYNVPYYPEVYKRSGYSDDRLGPDGSYELAPRAKIFRRDQGKVVDMESFKRLMRYANYSDPYALSETGEPDYGAAICMRGDLAKQGHGRPVGCYDTKVTSYLNGFWRLSAEIVNGPTSVSSDGTAGSSGNPPFRWRAMDQGVAHHGLPAAYEFDFMRTQPRNQSKPASILV